MPTFEQAFRALYLNSSMSFSTFFKIAFFSEIASLDQFFEDFMGDGDCCAATTRGGAAVGDDGGSAMVKFYIRQAKVEKLQTY